MTFVTQDTIDKETIVTVEQDGHGGVNLLVTRKEVSMSVLNLSKAGTIRPHVYRTSIIRELNLVPKENDLYHSEVLIEESDS